ncbi:hypothetical protein FHQ18_01940 [Deferribacter autotrophicus]|uniref:Uncharacterized protein n=1 Tax=Deferribacter autotrophicus TaxID=500465 RepID=A0A5A8F660_9BACT|nr:hypothetical protein [Deferribacter autotrophicus]KAA0259235.1 hypothetical protein FHQ18_01940 [Deferribacter autotrophicus]
MFKVGIFANDSLLLSELVETLNNRGLSILTNIYTEQGYLDSMDNSDFVNINSVPERFEDDFLIVLSDISNYLERLKGYERKVIDFSRTVRGVKHVSYISEPILYCLEQLDMDEDDIFAVINVPAAVFGKAAVDDLLNQTRDIFSFTRSVYKVLDKMLPFNYFFIKEDNNIFKNYLSFLKENLEVDFELRMLPVSTGFVIDIYGECEIEDDKIFEERSIDTLQEALEGEKVSYFKNNKKITLVGDYLKVIINQIMDEIK